MTDLTNIRPGEIITVLPKATDVRGDSYPAAVRTVVLAERGVSGGVWTVDGRWVPAARVAVRDDSIETRMATAAIKAEVHAGLADALENGTVRATRVEGVHVLTAAHDGRYFTVRVYPNTGMASCNGFVVNSTCRDLAHAALAAIRNR